MANYNPRKERSLKRRTSYRDIKQSFLIICEKLSQTISMLSGLTSAW